MFIRRTDAEADVPILWPPDAKSWLIAGSRPCCWERLRVGGEECREDEVVGWHHRFSECEFEQTQGDIKDREAWCATVNGVT